MYSRHNSHLHIVGGGHNTAVCMKLQANNPLRPPFIGTQLHPQPPPPYRIFPSAPTPNTIHIPACPPNRPQAHVSQTFGPGWELSDV